MEEQTGKKRKKQTALSPEARKTRAEYLKRYRKLNPDRQRQWSKNYWEKKALSAQSTEERQED